MAMPTNLQVRGKSLYTCNLGVPDVVSWERGLPLEEADET